MDPPQSPDKQKQTRQLHAFLMIVKILSNINEIFKTCPLCFERISHPVVTQCGHLFCKTCYETGKTMMTFCPICRNKCIIASPWKTRMPQCTVLETPKHDR